MKEVELTNESRHYLLPLHKQVHDERGIAESLHTTSIGICDELTVGMAHHTGQ